MNKPGTVVSLQYATRPCERRALLLALVPPGDGVLNCLGGHSRTALLLVVSEGQLTTRPACLLSAEAAAPEGPHGA